MPRGSGHRKPGGRFSAPPIAFGSASGRSGAASAATALCLTDVADPERTAPALSRCSPDRCPNACLTARHREPWQASIAEGEGLLADRRLSPLQREAIARDNERKRRLIAPLIEGAA